MRYPVDYVRYAAKEIRKIEGRMRLEEGEVSKEELQNFLSHIEGTRRDRQRH